MFKALVLSTCAIAILPAAEVIKAIPYSELLTAPGAITDSTTGSHVVIREGEALSDVKVSPAGNSGVARVLVRLPAVSAVSGVLTVFPDDGAGKALLVPFTIPKEVVAAAADGSKEFAKATARNCRLMLNLPDAGDGGIVPSSTDAASRAWWSWRHEQAREVDNSIDILQLGRGNNDRLDDTMDFFSGMTAVSENLQFDRQLAINGGGESTVALNELPTLTLREVPWERMPSAKDPLPTLDYLASRIPIDQHAVLLPSFAALTATINQGDGLLAGPLHLATGRGEDAGILRRYQRQLGLELNELSKRFGAQVIDAVAITGSDPYLRVGTDVAILLRAKQPALLAGYLELKRQGLVTAGATASDGTIGGLAWKAAVSRDRAVSSYMVIDGDVALVTNSLTQVEAFAAVKSKQRPALDTAPEMTFFRRRYSIGLDGEIALAVISDATIRRWCSARCRIGDSRRTRAAVALGRFQAQWIAAGCPAGWTPPSPNPELGTITIGPRGVQSSLYGSLHFMTPIAELALDRATTAEADAFRRFIQRYENSWRDALDPIALRLVTRPQGGLGIDLSVLPLIIRSDYIELLNWVGKAHISAGSGDPHAAAIQLAVAMDRDGEVLSKANREAGRLLAGIASPLGWLGDTASLYADEDPFWTELMTLSADEREEALQRRLHDLPIGLNIAVREPLSLVAFLAGLRAFAEQSAPGMLSWETRTFAEVPYVRVAATNEARASGMLGDEVDAQLLYLAAPEGFTLTMSQKVMERAITRLKERRANKVPPAADPSWEGNQAAIRITPRVIDLIQQLDERGGARTWMYERNAANIAILNEWRRLFPQEDPVTVHERLWGVRPHCVAGGTYRWNAEWLTMESSALGSDFRETEGPLLPGGLEHLGLISSALSFEELPVAQTPVGPLVPGEREVTVQTGNTWRAIAEDHDVRPEDLAQRNGADVQDQLPVGRRLIVPRRSAERSRSVGLRVQVEIRPASTPPSATPVPAAVPVP